MDGVARVTNSSGYSKMIALLLALSIVYVDSTFLTILIGLVPILFIVGVILGIVIFRIMIGGAARAVWSSRRRKIPLLLHMGQDGLWKLNNMLRGFAGFWRYGPINIIPDEKGVVPLVDASPMGIAHTASSSIINADFAYGATKFVEAYEKGVEMDDGKGGKNIRHLTPSQIADFVEALTIREVEVRDILAVINRVNNGEISIDDAVTKMLVERQMPPDDSTEFEKMKSNLQGAIDTQGRAYQDELKRIYQAKTIPIEEGGWRLVTKRTKGLKRRIRTFIEGIAVDVSLNMADWQSFLPTGSDINTVTTVMNESNMAAKLEFKQNTGQTAKWLTTAVAFFIVLLGIYIVAQGMHVV